MRSAASPAWAMPLLAALAGCVGSGIGVPFPDPALQGEEPRSFPEIQARIFDGLCAPTCHGGSAPARGLDLSAGRSLRSLVDVESTEVAGMLRVDPGHSERSYLVVKIEPADPRRVGSRMPRTGPPFLSPAEIRGIRRWIDAGARDDWQWEDPTPAVGDDDDSAADDDDSAEGRR